MVAVCDDNRQFGGGLGHGYLKLQKSVRGKGYSYLGWSIVQSILD